MANQSITLGVDLLQNGNTVYSEDQPATTNDFGLVNLEIGRGTVLSGTFDQIDWSVPTTVRLWLDSGNGFQQIGDSELLSVPYAMYAANGGGGADDDPDPTNELQTLSQNGSEITLSNNGGTVSINDADADPTNELQNWSNLPGIPADIADGDQVDDADADPANEIELPTDAVAGDMAYYDGTTWKRVPDGKGGQTLTLRNNGNPVWNGPSTEDLKEVLLPNGQLIYWHPTDNLQNSLTRPMGSAYVHLPEAGITTLQEAIDDLRGESSTALMVETYGNGAYAAKFCQDLVAFGFDDWYLPSYGEIYNIYQAYGAPGANEITSGIYQTSTVDDSGGGVFGRVLQFDFATGQFTIGTPGDNPEARCRCVRK